MEATGIRKEEDGIVGGDSSNTNKRYKSQIHIQTLQ